MNNEKKPIKIKLSISVIIIVIIMLLSVVTIYFLIESLEKDKLEIESNQQKVQESINRNNIVNDEIDVKENNKGKQESQRENNKAKGIKIVQFDEEFYKVEDVAIESRKCENIKNYKDFEYDLDGDGKKDKVTVVHKTEKQDNGMGQTYEEDKYEFKLNDKIFYEENHPSFTEIFITDLNKNDKSIEVVIFDNGPSEDPHCLIFSKIDSKMKKIKELGWSLYTNQKGKIVCSEIHRATTTPEIFPNYYVLENNEIKKKDIDFSKIKNETFTAKDILFTEDMKNIDKYWELSASPKYQGDHEPDEVFKDAGIIKLTEKDVFNVIGYYKDIDIQIKLKDGRNGYLLGNHFSD